MKAEATISQLRRGVTAGPSPAAPVRDEQTASKVSDLSARGWRVSRIAKAVGLRPGTLRELYQVEIDATSGPLAQQELSQQLVENTTRAARGSFNSLISLPVNDRVPRVPLPPGLLPHEWLLLVMRGDPIKQKVYDPKKGEYVDTDVYAAFETRVEAARAAAPFFAPKLALEAIDMTVRGMLGTIDAQSLRGMNNKELEQLTSLLGKATSNMESEAIEHGR